MIRKITYRKNYGILQIVKLRNITKRYGMLRYVKLRIVKLRNIINRKIAEYYKS
jgi:hypothetical protein